MIKIAHCGSLQDCWEKQFYCTCNNSWRLIAYLFKYNKFISSIHRSKNSRLIKIVKKAYKTTDDCTNSILFFLYFNHHELFLLRGDCYSITFNPFQSVYIYIFHNLKILTLIFFLMGFKLDISYMNQQEGKKVCKIFGIFRNRKILEGVTSQRKG